jgi:hypothetical protein
MTTIELPIAEPLPEGCECTWQFHPKTGLKSIKVFHANCPVAAHVMAHRHDDLIEPPAVEVPAAKRGRGRPRNEAGQWHKQGKTKSA